MKSNKILKLVAASLLVLGCEQDIPELTPPAAPQLPTGSPGSLDLSKFVAIGNSLTAGFQAGALFDEGQKESLAAILAQQFAYAGGPSTFVQPDINAVNGYNLSSSIPGVITLGRLVLFDPDGAGPRTPSPTPAGAPARSITCPEALETPAMPAPYNSGDPITPYAGDRSKIQNFGIPGMRLIEVNFTGYHQLNPYYGRFTQSGKSVLAEALEKQPSFLMFFLGNNDVLKYALRGGIDNADPDPSPEAIGPDDMTPTVIFDAAYKGVINAILGTLPNVKVVVGNIPDITTIPHFFTVRYNAVPLNKEKADALNASFASYNQLLDLFKTAPFNLPAAQMDARKISFAASPNNRLLIKDETLIDLSPILDQLVALEQMTAQQRAQLAPYVQVRQATENDLIPLSAGAVIGTCVGDNAQLINGVSIPLEDRFVLIPSEIEKIKTRTAEFNTIIKNVVDASEGRLALADVNKALADLITNKAFVQNGVTLQPTIAPPTAGFSEDGVHPNGRGLAFLANVFIDAINQKFGATIPKADISKFRGNRTPVTPGSTY